MEQPNEVQVNDYITKHHTDIYDPIDPARLTLPPGYVVCILGASSGIGEHIAYAYAAAGARGIVLAGRAASLDAAAAVARSARSRAPSATVITAACDLTSSASVADLAREIDTRFARLDAVVVNAGYAGPAVQLRPDEGDPAVFRAAAEVNYLGAYHAARWLLPLVRRGDSGAGKTFVVVSALAALMTRGPIANVAYCVSKMAQARLVEMIAEQYGADGVLAVAVHPGAVRTKMAEASPDEFLPYLIDSPALCGGFCVWLGVDRARRQWMTGRFLCATWDVDELLSREEDIVARDLLKFKMTI
ncbi:hypothetical protein GGR52DRAFT_307125 [Hypoxylon sp. FL1284]|nr:hypothetical protein GGR52DRAFT_307125 [Hypoxylon sp. FL1284]